MTVGAGALDSPHNGRFVKRPYGFCFSLYKIMRADDIRPYGHSSLHSIQS